MNFWIELPSRSRPLVVTLIEAPAEQAGLVGQTAALAGPDQPPHGPLTETECWPRHWPGHFAALLTNWPNREHGETVSPEPGWRYFIYRVQPDKSALVLGGGHVGRAVAEALHFLDYQVTVFDDRPEFAAEENFPAGTVRLCRPFSQAGALAAENDFDVAVIVTRGHASDLEVLRQFMGLPALPHYLGMIGSRRRTRETLKLLAEEGVPAERLASIHTPIGLPIKAETPEEIAISIVAEIISLR